MSAKSDARKQLAVDAEVERLRLKEASMTDADRTKLAKRHRRRTIFLVVILAFIAAGVIGAVVAGPTKSAVDAGAQMSCQHFRNVMSDISNGLLTDTEAHAKFQQIYSDARVSTNTGIASNAQVMLSADVSGNSNALNAAMVNFSNSCAAVGY